MVPLNNLDALIFTGGIGENSDLVRKKTIDSLAILGFKCNDERNAEARKHEMTSINEESSHTILVIKTDEENMIAEDTFSIISER